MDDADLTAGDRVKANHRGGTPIAKITLMDGTVTYWCEETVAATDHTNSPEGAKWKANGTRDLSDLNIETEIIAR